MNNNTSGVSENRPMSGLSLNSGSSFRRSLGMGVPSVPSTPVLSTIFSATIIVNKDNAGYGMKVSGDKPVYVQSVKDGGAAQRAGLHSGDKIIKVNGVDVTHSTHTEVVALIKANAQVVLTVQQRPACGDMCSGRGLQPVLSPTNSSNIVSSGRAGITAPRPVDNEKMRQLEVQRVQTLRMMLEEEQKHLTTIRSKAGKRQEIQRAEARVHTLQEQLKALDAEGCPATSSHNVIQSDHTTTSHFNPHFLSRFPRSLSNLSLGGRTKKPEKDSPTDSNRNKPDKNAKNHQMQQDKRCLVDEKCDERESRASLIIDAPPPLPQRNKNMVGWLQEQTSVDHSTDLDHSTDEGMKQVIHSFLDHERNAFKDSENNKSDPNNFNHANAPPPLPPRQDRPLPNSIDTIMNYPLVSTCAPTLCNNNPNPALPGKSLTPSHKRVQSSPDPVTLSSESNFADRQTKSSSGSWGNTEATPPGTPPPPYPSPTNADEENADGWNRLHSCSPIAISSSELHNRSNPLAYSSNDPIQAAQSIVAQQRIISMEDEEISDTEVAVEEHGPFKSLRLLLEHPGHVAVFLNYLFTNAQPTSLLFYLITDLYREGNLKDMRRWAYEIHSTFLVPGAPLHLNNVDETMAREIDDVLLYESDKEEILRKIFLRARTRAKEELTSQLNDFQVTRTVGLSMLFGPNDVSLDVAIGDRSKEIRVIETALLSNMESYVDDLDPNKDKLDCKRHATAQALATVLLRWFRIPLGSHSVFSSFLERCPTFVSKEKTFRGKLIGKSRKLVVREHHLLSRQYYIVTHCNQCHDIIWGVGPQGYHCSDCGLNIHRGCSRVLEEDCPGPPVNPNSKSKQNQTDRRISKLMEKIRPNHHSNSAEKQRLQEEESVEDTSPSNERPSSSAILNRSATQRGVSTPEKGDGADDRLGDPEPENECLKPKSAPVSVNRSESYKERLSQRRNMNQRRKTSDPNLSKTIDDTRDHNISHTTSSTSSSTSSLSSRSLDSPSISLEAVHGGAGGTGGTPAAGYSGSMSGAGHSAGLHGGDSDEGEDRRDWTIQVPPEILATLTDKDKKCQEVINELILTERSHIRTLSLLDRVFRAPLQSNAILPPEQFQLLFPASLRRLQEWHGLLGQRLRHWRKQAGPVSSGIGDLLLGMFDGPSGEELKQAAASFCEHQQIALEGLKERRRKEPRLHQLLTEAESHPACRRLQLKDLLPMACFMRLTKYPLLFENLLKCIDEDNPELQNIKKAMDLSKAILNHVNNAVREAENVHKLQLIQKKLDKSGYDKFADQYQQVSDHKNLDLTQYRIIHDGTLILRQQKSELPLYAILLDGLLVLLLRQDEKYILKFHQSTGSSESGRPDRASPIIKLSSAIVRPLASAKNTFFVIVTSQNSQMYEFATHTEKEYNLWYKLISDCILAVEATHKVRPKFPFELHSDNHETDPVVPDTPSSSTEIQTHDCSNDCNYSNTDLGRLPEESETDSIETDNAPNTTDLQESKQESEQGEKDTKNGENIIRQNPTFNMRIVTQSNNLICPNQVKVSSVSEIHAAEPVLTVFEQLRRADTAIHEALTWKQKLVGQILGIPEEHYAVIADMAPMSGVQEVGEVLLTAIQQAQQLAQLLADSTDLTEEQIMLAQLNRSKIQSANYCDSCSRNRTICDPIKTSVKDLDESLENIENLKEIPIATEVNKSKVEISNDNLANLFNTPFSDCKTCCMTKQWIPSVPADKLSELVNAVIPTLTYLLELFKGHDKDREALRKELQRQRELMHHMISQNSQEKVCYEKENDKTE